MTLEEEKLELVNRLLLKNSSNRSIWTYLTASPCYTTTTNKHVYTTNTYISRNKQQINAATQSLYKYAQTPELHLETKGVGADREGGGVGGGRYTDTED